MTDALQTAQHNALWAALGPLGSDAAVLAFPNVIHWGAGGNGPNGFPVAFGNTNNAYIFGDAGDALSDVSYNMRVNGRTHWEFGMDYALTDGVANQSFHLKEVRGASFQGQIVGLVLTVTAMIEGKIEAGQQLISANAAAGQSITALGTGIGGTGTYTVGIAQTVASERMVSEAYTDRIVVQDENSPRYPFIDFLPAAGTAPIAGEQGHTFTRTYAGPGKRAVHVWGNASYPGGAGATGEGLTIAWEGDNSIARFQAATWGSFYRDMQFEANNIRFSAGAVYLNPDQAVFRAQGGVSAGPAIATATDANVSNAGDAGIALMSLYVPGVDVLTAQGGTGLAPTFTVTDTQVSRVNSIAAAGTGGTPGAVVLTGTTGTGTKFQVNGVISAGGALVSTGSFVTHGDYTVNPASLTNAPVTGGGLAGCQLNISMGALFVSLTTAGALTSIPVTPVATTSSAAGTGATLDIHYAQLNLGSLSVVRLFVDGQKLLPAPVATSNPQFIPVGDSLTAGYSGHGYAYNPPAPDFLTPYDHYLSLPAYRGLAWTDVNLGIGGQTAANALTNLPDYVARVRSPAAPVNLFAVMLGRNDVAGGATAAATYASLTAIVAYLHATGDKVALITTPSSADNALGNTIDATLSTLRGLVNANAAAADLVIDLGANAHFTPGLGTPAWQNTTYYYTDGIHLTATGYALMGSIAQTALATYIATLPTAHTYFPNFPWLTLGEITFANRPATAPAGTMANFSDSNTAVWGAAIAGGGANRVLARWNGANWTVVGI